jgi:hypothetical protein
LLPDTKKPHRRKKDLQLGATFYCDLAETFISPMVFTCLFTRSQSPFANEEEEDARAGWAP